MPHWDIRSQSLVYIVVKLVRGQKCILYTNALFKFQCFESYFECLNGNSGLGRERQSHRRVGGDVDGGADVLQRGEALRHGRRALGVGRPHLEGLEKNIIYSDVSLSIVRSNRTAVKRVKLSL